MILAEDIARCLDADHNVPPLRLLSVAPKDCDLLARSKL